MVIRNIILTGFMGTGKSTVGPALAQALGWQFVDMDNLIEQREGRAIREIFAAAGEAYFRRLETDLCRELNTWQNRVIATGGGTLVNPRNLKTVSAHNLVVCLDCAPDMLWERLSVATDRPMLDGNDRKTQLLNLLVQRQPAYARIPHHIDTTRTAVETVVTQVMTLWNRLDPRESGNDKLQQTWFRVEDGDI